MKPADHPRDAAGTVAVCAFFASAWFGWAHSGAPSGWMTSLTVLSVSSVLMAVLGGVLVWRRWSAGTALDRPTAKRFGVVVAVEVVLAGAGSALLSGIGHGELTPVWISFVVGVHFFPLGSLFGYPLYRLVAGGIVVVAIVTIPLARSLGLADSTVTGVGTGAVLLAAAVWSLAIICRSMPTTRPAGS